MSVRFRLGPLVQKLFLTYFYIFICMKWTKTLDEELINLIQNGNNHAEIAEIFKTTSKSIQNRCFRLKIQVTTHKDIVCKQCKNIVKDIASSKREFCSNSCANTYTNLNRTHSQETKDKIGKKIREFNSKKENIKVKKIKTSLNRQCKLCQDFKVNKKQKSICEDCRFDYYKAYRPSCEFRFTLSDYQDEFDFELIKKHGWYSPSNKDNNLKGV